MRYLALITVLLLFFNLSAQYEIKGKVFESEGPLSEVNIYIRDSNEGTVSSADGSFSLATSKRAGTIVVSRVGFHSWEKTFSFKTSTVVNLGAIELLADYSLDEVVLSGNLKPVSRKATAVPIELYQPAFFKNKPNASIFEAISAINGVRPQINCAVCATGDIHINGQEGANTMVLIDGMPIVSGLGTVYGLMGVPTSIVKNIEVIKGPASTLFGSEAIGGVININTQNPGLYEDASVDFYFTEWEEKNLDIGVAYGNKAKTKGIIGINVFSNNQPIDNNGDGFTDLVLSNRFSIFNKINHGNFSIGGRLLYEDRWGGQLGFDSSIHRLGNKVYGEHIRTRRIELFGSHSFNNSNSIQFSGNRHFQDAAYGNMSYIGDQRIGFLQYVNHTPLGQNHELTSGLSYRYTYYDDNTPATEQKDHQHLPGMFSQATFSIKNKNQLVAGMRLEYHSKHGMIASPRLNFKIQNEDQTEALRISLGNGYRVVNLFTEDHAALTGSREVVIENDLNPEKSWNVSANHSKTFTTLNSLLLSVESSLFYSVFSNRLLPDYDTNPNQIIYANLKEKARLLGFSIGLNTTHTSGANLSIGVTMIDTRIETGERVIRPILTERYSSVYQLNIPLDSKKMSFNISGDITGPMRLPLLSELDPRRAFSPMIHIMNARLTLSLVTNLDVNIGLRNILNFTPPEDSIARSFDPFDKDVLFDTNGNALPTADNPYALTFDPSYSYTSFQGRNIFIGLSYKF